MEQICSRLVVLLAIGLVIGSFGLADAATITYQGRLVDNAGDPVIGQKDATFRIYSTEVAGPDLWDETVQLKCDTNGVFTVELGLINPIEPVIFNGEDRFLGIEVVGDQKEMEPRQLLTPATFALNAGGVIDGVITEAKIAPNAVTSGKIADGTIASDDLASNSVDAAKIATGAVASDEILDGAILDADIGASAAISPAKISGFPGVAQGVTTKNATISKDIGGVQMIAVASVTIDIPAPGYVVVDASAHAYLPAADPWEVVGMTYQIDTTAGGSTLTVSPQAIGFEPHTGTTQVTLPVSARRIYHENQDGLHTYYLEARQETGSMDQVIYNATVTAMFFPIDYGTVPVESGSGGVNIEDQNAAPTPGGSGQ